MAKLTFLVAVLLIAMYARAATPGAMLRATPLVPPVEAPNGPIYSHDGTRLPPLNTTYTFNQLKDHNNSGLGTFAQRYWINWQFYSPGGPIILFTPGQANAESYTGYLTNATLNGLLAQQQGGVTIVLEHRFFGLSNPYPDLSSQSLAVLTIQQAIEDLVYFAQNVNLPMPGGDKVKPDTTPWILVGGSYSGALTSWTMVNKPGVFYAGYSSSGVVQVMEDYWAYSYPVQEYMPQNCSSDVQRVIAYLDTLYAVNDTEKQQELKTTFGLGALSHIDDFALALVLNILDWERMSPSTGPGAMFYQFCDALEVKDGQIADQNGWGLEHAIQAWGGFFNASYTHYTCGDMDIETCYGSYNASQPYWTITTIDNPNRSWMWLLCNQIGLYPDGPPANQPAIVSRIVTAKYYQRWCTNEFPEAFSSPPVPKTEQVNMDYHGWSVEVDRLFFANGKRDPWREVTVSSEFIIKPSTDMQPIYLSDGFHCSDLQTVNGVVDPTVANVQSAALAYMKMWLEDWPGDESQ